MFNVIYLPKQVAAKLPHPMNMVSITSPYESPQQFPVTHRRLLRLQFMPTDQDPQSEQQKKYVFDETMAQQVIDFVKSCNGEDIVVHCGEGRIRSPAIANFIEFMSRGEDGKFYSVQHKYPGSVGSDASMDRGLFWALREQYAKESK